MDDDATTPNDPTPEDRTPEDPTGHAGWGWTPAAAGAPVPPEASIAGSSMSDEVPEVSADETWAQPAGGAAPPTVATPWWSAAAATPAPPAPTAPPSPSSRRGRPVIVGAIAGALVSALVTGGLFVAFRDDTTSSSNTSTPLALSGASTRDTVALPQGASGSIDIHAVLARIQPSVVRVKVTTADGSGGGTGIVIDPNGTIVTNAHVVADAATIQVQLPNGDLVPATSKGVDVAHDLAVITIARNNLASASLGDSDALQVGDPVIAVGNALDLGISVTNGIVSAIDRDVPEENGNTLYGALQTDAAINPGNSGGPLVNARGEVIGINTAIARPDQANNVGFAIAISAVKPIIEDLANGTTPHDALLGVSSQPVTSSIVSKNHLTVTEGVFVLEVSDGTAAQKAGIVRGDVITSFDGRPVTSTEEMRRYIRRHRPGDKVQIVFVRADGSRRTTTVTLGADQQG